MLRILLLEDNDFDAELVQRELRTSGLAFEIVRAEDKARYLELLDEPFDLVLADYSVPGIPKGAAFDLAKERSSQVPFILLSGALPEEAVADFLKAGVTDFVNKDRLERLPIAVRRALEEAERRKALADAQQDLIRAKEAAEQANLAKDRFLAALSHELRTPLTPVMLSLELALLDEDLPPSLAGTLETMRRNLELEVQLINDLLDLTAISKGKLQLRRERVDFRKLVESAVQICQAEAAEKGITLRSTVVETPLVVDADARRTQQAIWNLLRNAIKFSGEGDAVDLSLEGREGSVRFDVTDHGIGIAPENLERIFSPFDQVMSVKRGGLGLGLAIAREIIAALGGRVWAASQGEGTGARFTIELPLAGSNDPADHERAGRSMAPERRSARVLLVEDNADTARAMSELLRLEGFTVELAETCAAARRSLETSEFDLLVSDIGLPDGNGYELRQGIRPGRLKSIALTGYGQESDVQRALASGFDDQLTKPVDLDTFLQRIDALLSSRLSS